MFKPAGRLTYGLFVDSIGGFVGEGIGGGGGIGDTHGGCIDIVTAGAKDEMPANFACIGGTDANVFGEDEANDGHGEVGWAAAVLSGEGYGAKAAGVFTALVVDFVDRNADGNATIGVDVAKGHADVEGSPHAFDGLRGKDDGFCIVAWIEVNVGFILARLGYMAVEPHGSALAEHCAELTCLNGCHVKGPPDDRQNIGAKTQATYLNIII